MSSEVIRGHQRSSEVIRSTEWKSEAIRGHERPSEALSGNQCPSAGRPTRCHLPRCHLAHLDEFARCVLVKLPILRQPGRRETEGRAPSLDHLRGSSCKATRGEGGTAYYGKGGTAYYGKGGTGCADGSLHQ